MAPKFCYYAKSISRAISLGVGSCLTSFNPHSSIPGDLVWSFSSLALPFSVLTQAGDTINSAFPSGQPRLSIQIYPRFVIIHCITSGSTHHLSQHSFFTGFVGPIILIYYIDIILIWSNYIDIASLSLPLTPLWIHPGWRSYEFKWCELVCVLCTQIYLNISKQIGENWNIICWKRYFSLKSWEKNPELSP